MWAGRPLRSARPVAVPAVAGLGYASRRALACAGFALSSASMLTISPSYMKTPAESDPHRARAFFTMVSNTGWTSVGELLMTRRISPVAVCCSRVSVNARLRRSSSPNRLTFSIAITAWSAKVWSRAIWLGEKGPGFGRSTVITPIGTPSRSIGTAMMPQNVAAVATAPTAYSGSSRTSGMWAIRRSSTARPAAVPRPGGAGQML